MDEKLLLQLAQMMGGPNGRGAPLRDEAVGMIDARGSGVPLQANDGRNQKTADENERHWLKIKDKIASSIMNSEPTPEPTPTKSLVESLFTSLDQAALEYLMYKMRDAGRSPLMGYDPEGKDTRPQSPDIARTGGDK